MITEEKDDVTGLSFITEEEEVITESSAINQSMSLLDTSALPQAPEVVAPTPATVQIKAGTLLESASKWDGLKLPPLDFTDENKPVADDGSSTDSEFEFFKSKPVREIVCLVFACTACLHIYSLGGNSHIFSSKTA